MELYRAARAAVLLYFHLAQGQASSSGGRPWPSQREMATVRVGLPLFWTQVQTLMNPLSPPHAPDGNGKSECTCCISLHITLLLWKIVCYFGTPWQPEWIAEGPKLVYLVSEAKPNERHLAQHLKNGKKLGESKNNQGLREMVPRWAACAG